MNVWIGNDLLVIGADVTLSAVPDGVALVWFITHDPAAQSAISIAAPEIVQRRAQWVPAIPPGDFLATAVQKAVLYLHSEASSAVVVPALGQDAHQVDRRTDAVARASWRHHGGRVSRGDGRRAASLMGREALRRRVVRSALLRPSRRTCGPSCHAFGWGEESRSAVIGHSPAWCCELGCSAARSGCSPSRGFGW